MPAKKRKPLVHMVISLTPEECKAAATALEIALDAAGFDCDALKISAESANAAFDKLLSGETEYTRGEIRATAAAISFVLSSDLAIDVTTRSTLNALSPRFHAYVLHLKKLR